MVRMRMIFMIFFLTNVAYSHGLGKPGPHNGYIKMVANFHTELVTNDYGLIVYLLDMGFKNSTVLDSNVQAIYQYKDNAEENVNCRPQADHFLCPKIKKISLLKKISLIAVRQKIDPKQRAEYLWPLTY